MSQIETRIAAGLERAFATQGFAEPNTEALRDAAGVSLRTLYKYAPSRDAMVRQALEHRHARYMGFVFKDLPDKAVLDAMIGRVADWMHSEASHGCLFHAAVAAAPQDTELRALLARHKSEFQVRAARVTGLPEKADEILLIFEGLTQSWPLLGARAVQAARQLASGLNQPQ